MFRQLQLPLAICDDISKESWEKNAVKEKTYRYMVLCNFAKVKKYEDEITININKDPDGSFKPHQYLK